MIFPSSDSTYVEDSKTSPTSIDKPSRFDLRNISWEKTTEEVINVPGTACLDLTEDIEIKLGDLEQRVFNADYYQQNVNFNEDITINTNTDVTL